MKTLIVLSIFISNLAIAEGYYYPVPANPHPLHYVLPPAYIVPPQQIYAPPPVFVPQVQRGYIQPPPPGWADSKVIPLPPRVNSYPNK